MNLLHLDASVMGEHSISRDLTASIVDAFRDEDRDIHVEYRDLAADPVPHWQPPDGTSREPDAYGTALFDQFMAADVVVIGAPMYNFGIPTQLKAWIDHLAIPGRAFRYSENGPEGLAGGRRVIVASARGGVYSGTSPVAGLDHQEAYLRAFFGFIGIEDVQFIRAEGIAMGSERRAQAIAGAKRGIAEAVLQPA